MGSIGITKVIAKIVALNVLLVLLRMNAQVVDKILYYCKIIIAMGLVETNTIMESLVIWSKEKNMMDAQITVQCRKTSNAN